MTCAAPGSLPRRRCWHCRAPAAGAGCAAGIEDLRPEGMQLSTTLGVEELPIGSRRRRCRRAGNDAVSDQRRDLRPRPIDDAYGAFQRGYFLTALELALPRAEKGDRRGADADRRDLRQGPGRRREPAAGCRLVRAGQRGTAIRSPPSSWRMMYQDGRGVPQEPRARRRAVPAGGRRAAACRPSTISACCTSRAPMRAPDLVKAAELIGAGRRRPALAEAQYDYGTMLIEGAGVAPDPREGAEQIGLAAEQGLADAQIDYATLLYLGKGVARDLAEAVRWYARAAEGRQSGGPEPLCQAAGRRRGRRRSTSKRRPCGARWRAGRASPIRCSTSCWSRSRPTNWPGPRNAPASGRAAAAVPSGFGAHAAQPQALEPARSGAQARNPPRNPSARTRKAPSCPKSTATKSAPAMSSCIRTSSGLRSRPTT